MSFIIVALAFIVLQTAVAPWLEILQARPDWVLVLLVHLSLRAPKSEGLLGGWFLGLLVDLWASTPFGMFSFLYGLTALGIVRVRGLLFRDQTLTSLGVTLAAALAMHTVVAVYRLGTDPDTRLLSALGLAFTTGLYTAMFAPPIHHLLRRANSWLGLRTTGRAHFVEI